MAGTKGNVVEMQTPMGNGENGQKPIIDEEVAWAVKPGNQQDELDMRRMGQKQSLSVRRPRKSQDKADLYAEKLSFLLHTRSDNRRNEHVGRVANSKPNRHYQWG